MNVRLRPLFYRAAVTTMVALSTVGCAQLASKKPYADEQTPRPKSIAPFSTAMPNGGYPPGWEPYVLRRDRRATQYGLATINGQTVLRATANDASASAICRVEIAPTESPWLTWQWKVDRLVENANVSLDDFDDSPTRVFIAFDGDQLRMPAADIAFFDMVKFFTGKDLPYATLSYVWDPKLPVDTVVSYSRSSRIKYIVVESGHERLGQWVSYRRNVVDDYRRAFGEAPGTIISIGVMNDSDDLRQQSESFFGDIALQSPTELHTDIGIVKSPDSPVDPKQN